jgi:glycosyltransferase involved in cell wall biosynthesis
LAVVVSPCAGNVDVIDEGRTGWIYRSPAHAAELVARLLDDAPGAASVLRRANAMEMARKRFSEERYIQDIHALLENQVTKPGRGR